MRSIFVAGIDTGVGKTVVTGLLKCLLREKGYDVATQKWIQTGSRLPGGAMYNFRFAASPHLAARLEGKKIDVRRIKKGFRLLSKRHDFVIVEGTGGVLVPVTEKKLLIDIVKELGMPVLIVAANRLGAINHALLTIEALKRRKIDIVGIIFNNLKKNESEPILKDNPKIVAYISGVKVLGILPYLRRR